MYSIFFSEQGLEKARNTAVTVPALCESDS